MILYETALRACLTAAPNEKRRPGEVRKRRFDASQSQSKKHRHDDLGSALDQPFPVTFFLNHAAFRKKTKRLTLRTLKGEVESTTAPTKAALPWLKFATFGYERTEKGSLRNNANVQSITGVEADYDGGVISIDEAARRIREAGIAALVYSTPASTDERPRWRVFAPFGKERAPEVRTQFAEKLNALFDGQIDQQASFTLSQSFLFGQALDGEQIETRLVDGKFIDRVPNLPRLPKGERIRQDDEAEAARDESGSAELFRLAVEIKTECGTLSDLVAAIPDYPKAQAHVERNGARAIERAWERAPDHAPLSVDELRWIFDNDPAWRGFKFDNPEPSHLSFLSPADCEAAESRGYVVKGLLAPGDIGCIFGAPGVGKSLIAPHIAYAVAQGRSAFRMRTKPGKVFYVAAEDETGMKGRVRALKDRHGNASDFTLVAGCSDLMSAGSPDLRALIEAVKAQKPKLIFIDTLAMAFPGLEENDGASMRRVVAVARKLASFGTAVVLVHHDSKTGGGTPRGHSVLNGALDMALYLTKGDDGIVRGALTKNRNGTCERDIAFKIDVRVFGQDEDGDSLDAALADELADISGCYVRLTDSERAALDILRDELRGSASRDAWRNACAESPLISNSNDEKNRSRAARRIIKRLIENRIVSVDSLDRVSEFPWEDDADDLI